MLQSRPGNGSAGAAVLGVPGDARQEEIEAAFHNAESLFSKERLAQEDDALARLAALRHAYQVLRDPASRAAHDRKLQQGVRPAIRPRVVVEEDPSPVRKMMTVGLWLLVLVLGAGIFITYRNAETRKAQVAQEAAERRAAELEAERARQEQNRIAAQRAAAAAQAEAAERRLVMDSQISVARSAAALSAQDAAAAQARRAELAEAQRREATRVGEERRAAQEARMRTERDKQRVRELCLQLYRRSDC
jgi:curved DNA-binding protein CbpA